ncbi:MAG: T9SS type A sorting domain-containing protein [Dysgonamonadaceae bacterium]|jgi:hypothetical protein|nr:T9SS type A sorting domain-containing protein [Dysgonamonadaceae bacterium]
MKKITFLFAFLCSVLAANAAANYPTGGMTPLMNLIAKMDSTQGPRGDAAWPWVGPGNTHVWHSQADEYGVFTAMMYNEAFGIFASSDFESDGKTLPWATCGCGKYATLRGIDWTGKNYLQKTGSENNIVFETKSTSWDDLYFLEFLRLSGNRFRHLSIVGHVNGVDSLVNLKEVDLSGNGTMEYFSINGAPNLVMLKVNAATVEISGSTLLFSKLAGIQATTLNYTPAGTVHLTFPANTVDLSAEAAIGTAFANWSVEPVASNNGIFSFPGALAGQTVTVELTNTTYPELGTLMVEIKLTTPFYLVDTNIDSAAKLDSIRYNLAGEYTLTADIDLAAYLAEHYPEEGWLPIGDGIAPFSGKLIGNGHIISGLWSKRDTTDYVGLFGTLGYCRDIKTGESSAAVVGNDQTAGAEISDLGIVSDSIIGRYDVGGLAGIIGNKSCITGVYVKADVKGYASVGGLAGTFYGKNNTTLIKDCYVAGSVTGENKVGGVAGNAFNQEVAINISRVYTTNKVRNTGAWYQNTTGGFIGRYNAWYGLVKYHNCFAVNDTIDGINSGSTGRFVGSWVDQSKSTATTLYPFADNAFALDVMEYNNTETAAYRRILPNETGQDGVGEEFEILNKRNKQGFNIKADALKLQATYEASGWDFAEIWTMGNGEYPLPVLKKLTAAKQPAAYPAYLDAKPVYSVTLAVDTLDDELPHGIISLHSVFPYWEKNGILDGTDVPVYIRPDTNYELESLLVNEGEKIADVVNNVYTITAIAADTKVVGKFKASTTGINSGQAAAISVYPNPAKNELRIANLQSGETVKIYDLTGNLLLQSGKNILNISNFTSGIYFVKVAGTVTKIVKE